MGEPPLYGAGMKRVKSTGEGGENKKIRNTETVAMLLL